MQVSVRNYSPELASDWSKVLAESKNGLFQFDRKFIEYHGNRFGDLSSIAYVDDKPVALFPLAKNYETDEVISHPGLTFGGVVLSKEIRGGVSISAINALLDNAGRAGVTKITIKLLPQAFARYPAAEVDYVLWRRGFVVSRRDLSSILPLTNGLAFNNSKRQAVAKAAKAGVRIAPASAFEFHRLLSLVLQDQHGASPAHSVEDMELLGSRFPDDMCIVGAWKEDQLIAGSMLFRYGHVWHTQYLACSSEGRECGALDFVIDTIKQDAIAARVQYLSFGISTESAGTVLNDGLLWQKESFGARSITHDFMVGSLQSE